MQSFNSFMESERQLFEGWARTKEWTNLGRSSDDQHYEDFWTAAAWAAWYERAQIAYKRAKVTA